MKTLAAKRGIITVGELQRQVQFGDNCRRCIPYVRQMLATGQTVYKVVEVDDFEDLPNPTVASEFDDEASAAYGDEDEL